MPAPSQTNPFRVASVGLGRWAQVIAGGAARSPKLRLVACFSRDPERRRAFAHTHHCEPTDSYGEILADPEVEGVMITTPNDTHAPLIVQAAEAGKHVFVEKPIANTLEDAQRIVDACQRAGVRLAVGHSARHLGAVRAIRGLLEDGTLGEVSLVEANFSNDRGLELTPDRWRWYREQSPGGPLIQLAIHHVDTLQALFGPIASVSAHIRRLYTPAEVDDVALLACAFERGPLASITTSWATAGVYTITIYGTGGTAFYAVDFTWWSSGETDAHSALEFQARGPAERRAVAFEPVDMYRAELEDWAEAARGGLDPAVSGAEATSALRVVWAAIEAAATGRSVSVKRSVPV
jgi:predicted dehydrogenase